MGFLIRTTFWFSLVLLLLPFGGDDSEGPQVGPLQALLAARAAVSDFTGICERQPHVCETGKAALHTIGVRAKASARYAYEFLGDDEEPTKTVGGVVAGEQSGVEDVAAQDAIKTGTVSNKPTSNAKKAAAKKPAGAKKATATN